MRAAQNRWWKTAKAGSLLYTDRIQKQNSKVQILKIINLKNPGIIDWISGLGRKRWVLLWTELILLLVTQQKKFHKHFSLSQLRVLRSILFNIFEDQMES